MTDQFCVKFNHHYYFIHYFSCIKRRIRAVLAEKDVPSWGRAEVVIKLIDKGYEVDDSVEAARNCGDLARSLRYLKQECPLCTDERPMSQVCVHSVSYTQLVWLSTQSLLTCSCIDFSLYCVIVRVSVVLKRTVVGD